MNNEPDYDNLYFEEKKMHTPQVGDVWVENNNPKLRYHITENDGTFVYYAWYDIKGITTYSSVIWRFVKECSYLGKSKANINDLFKTENEECYSD